MAISKRLEDYQIFFGEEGDRHFLVNSRITFRINDSITFSIYVENVIKNTRVYFWRFRDEKKLTDLSVEDILESERISSSFKEKILFNLDLFRK